MFNAFWTPPAQFCVFAPIESKSPFLFTGFTYLQQHLRKQGGPKEPRIGSVPHFNDEDEAEEQDILKKGSTLSRQIGTCNELENEINNERAKNRLGPLKCDHNMRWVANKHVANQLDNGFTGWEVAFTLSNI